MSAYKGKQVSEAKHKARTFKCFLSNVEMSLWFSKSFGLEQDSLNVKEVVTAAIHNLQISHESGENTEDSEHKKRKR